jgi:adenylate cyclase
MASRKFVRPIVIAALLGSLVLLGHHQGILDVAELKSLDLRFKARGPISSRLPIVLISIDQDSFDEFDLPWPWPRTLHADLIRKLAGSHPRMIALDVLFTEPKADRREDQALADAVKDAGNVILPAEYTEVPSAFGPRTKVNLPIPILREHALGVGLVNLITDKDGVVRRAPLAMPFQDQWFPSFAYQISRRAAGENPSTVESLPAPVIINFRGPRGNYPVVPYYRVFRGEIDASFFRDRIVLIGAFAPSLHDVYPTPYSASLPTAGVEIQANLVETLVAADSIAPVARWLHAALFIVACGMTLSTALLFKPLRGFVIVLALVSIHGLLAFYLFAQHHLWLPVVPAFLAVSLTYGGLTLENYIREQKDRIRIRAMFDKYVSPDVVEEIMANREGLELGGRRRHITVLFADIRGFTALSERIEPEAVVSLLSDYLGRVTRIVFKHGGTVDKFIGDAVMVIFGVPRAHEDDAARAVRTGIEIIQLMESLAPVWTQAVGRPLKVGIGINTGDAVVGSIGSEIRYDYTAIGDTVNLASRLEALTKDFAVPMLLSEFTAAELNGAIRVRPVRLVKVADREAPVAVYTLESVPVGDETLPLNSAAPYEQRK